MVRISKKLLWIFGVFSFLCMAAMVCAAEAAETGTENHKSPGKWALVLSGIEEKLDSCVEAYSAALPGKAEACLNDAFLNSFEIGGLERRIKSRISDDRAVELERMFIDIRHAIASGEPLPLVREKVEGLKKALRADLESISAGKKTCGSKNLMLFLQSFIIIFRAGFESILVIGALCAYLKKTGHENRIGSIYFGALIAVLASIATIGLIQLLFTRSGEAREALEGFTMLFASVLMLYVGFWFMGKSGPAGLGGYFSQKMASLGARNMLALSATSFLAVYREGAETVLFYQALRATSQGEPDMIILGFFAGLASLGALYIALRFTVAKIPSGVLFFVSSLFLYFMGFTFAGKGVMELQEAGLLGASPADFPVIDFLGLYPTYEGLSIQAIFILVFSISLYFSFRKRPGTTLPC